MILLIDNYDSFVHNLARYVRELQFTTNVVRNDAITIEAINALHPSHIILSPGPCTPNEAGITLRVIHHFANQIPILGVCLGHQAIGQAFGCDIIRSPQPTHGKASRIQHDNSALFNGIPSPFNVARYHSLTVSPSSIPPCLRIIARTEMGEIMALQHTLYPIIGVQFHPESILTEYGHQLLSNFFRLTRPKP